MSSRADALGRRPGVGRLLAAQACVGIIAALGAWILAGGESALAAALGAASYLLPQAALAWRLFGREHANDVGAVVRALYVGEGLKLLTIALLLAGTFQAWPQVPPLPLVLALVAVQAAHWLAPLMLKS